MQILKSLNAILLATALLPFGAQAVDDYVLEITVGDSSDPASPQPSLCNSSPFQCTLRSAIQLANDQTGKVLISLATDVFLSNANPNENNGLDGDLDIKAADLVINGNSHTVHGVLSDRIFHIHKSRTEINDLTIEGGSLMYVTNSIDQLDTSISNAGGGIFVSELGDLALNNVILTNNSAPIGGAIASQGRLQINGTGSNAFDSSLIHNNYALNPTELIPGVDFQSDRVNPGQGGAIANFGGYLAVAATRITNNSAGVGGAIYNTSAGRSFGQAVLSNVVIDKNKSISHGAGIANQGPMNINQSAIIANEVVRGMPDLDIADLGTDLFGDGGGIFNGGIANIDISNTTISGNIARGGGGAYSSRNITFNNATIYNNTAIPCQTCLDTQSTIGGHQVAVFDSDLKAGSSGDPDLNFTNTVVASNPSNQNTGIDSCAGSTNFTQFILSQSNNFDDDGSCEFTSGTDLGGLIDNGGTITSSDPLLSPLSSGADYDLDISSGLTPAHEPAYYGVGHADNSPLVDNGNDSACSQWDQRFRQYIDVCDIGALESNPGPVIKDASQYVDLKVDITDSRDPVPPGSTQSDGQLQYTIGVTNLYQGPASLGAELHITLPQGSVFQFAETTRGDGIAYDAAAHSLIISLDRIDGLERITTTVTIIPPQYETTIQATVTIEPGPSQDDAFLANNTDVETTEVSTRASRDNDNWGGSGGGGSIHPLTLIILLTTVSFILGRKPI